MRIGQGFDVHRFQEGRPLLLGGVRVPYHLGLAGHSDADVLLHALSDALLGAVGEGDIGRHFPDTDPAYKDADSSKLLQEVYEIVQKKGFTLGNADLTVICQKPKLAPYINEMNTSIANLLNCDSSCINVKATTTEKLGFVGREEGIAAQAAVLLLTK
ncbi:2-C-methyl-D-erythritol 2,4-cyclodiphosphate synthase [Bacillaceae bacterium SIJ1]|uniref:2-C-methyl-D-erythritol 2,4-cyclodiphosphate synthase n=1 Tax=Litoribacterium kuwaitense TaxID=1398745 RepID=UPI0013E9BB0B|nr:2-C-methyl-D-erythritol 2,4-cyclodiphosphate synthase [Litoribacterium kuwaitense]NGP46717.1 2-C-methyl-D-erythritol 2,4-cyclodiphosphate synthase [Litoribacterium kuwaitense]